MTVASLDPSRPQLFVKHALGRFDHTLICVAVDVVFLQATGQCTDAFMKASESLCPFVWSSATGARLGRCSCGSGRLPFRSLWKIVFLIRWVHEWLRGSLPHVLVVVVSNGLSPGRAQEHVANTQLGLGRSVLEKTLRDCLLHSEQFPAHVFPQKSGSDKCNKETEC